MVSSYCCANISSEVTYVDLYKDWVHQFENAKIPEAKESAGYIIAHLLGRKTFSVIPQHDLVRIMTEEHRMQMIELCQKRLERVPVQYIIGEWDFFGVNLKMRRPVFIPRPETENLAELVLCDIQEKLKKKSSENQCKVLEVGCGSGAITLSLFNKLRNHPVEFVATDKKEHAVELTKENASYLGFQEDSSKLTVLQHTLCGQKDADHLMKLCPFDVIVSNPPYVSTADMKELPDEISRYEDETALHAGETGLDVIQDILEIAPILLAKNGSVWLEVDSTHPTILKSGFNKWISKSFEDQFGIERFCHLTARNVTT